MIQYWVRRGKIHEISSLTDCGSCGESGSCAFVLQMPRTYQLAREDTLTEVTVIAPACEHHRVKGE
jgi:ArsR family metal-binding transcriptional regulator